MIVTRPLTSEDWHRLRAQNIGASETAALFGLQAEYALSRWSLWQIKSGNAPPPQVTGERPAWGLRLEQAIAEAAQEQESWPSLTRIYYATDDTTPGLGCTPDYRIDAPGPNDVGCEGLGLLECKNVDWIIHKRSWTDDEPPPAILLQLQTQMACTGYMWGRVAGLVGGNELRIYRYAARPALIAEIRKRASEFWQSVRDGREPPIDGSDSAKAVLRSLFPEVEDDAIDMSFDNEWPDLCAELLKLAEHRKAVEKNEAALKLEIEQKLNGHRRGFGSGYNVSVSVTPAKPDGPAAPGEIIKGRAEVRRLNVREDRA